MTAADENLIQDLEKHVRGEVRFENLSRSAYSTDASNYRMVPLGVVLPMDVDDLIETVAVCHRHGAPILQRGGGTSLAGQSTNTAVVIDSSKYVNRILEIDPAQRLARVEPGVTFDQLKRATSRFGLVYGPDPATHEYCTIGGMIGNNACGVYSEFAGKTVDNVLELDVLTYDGLRLTVGPMSEAEVEADIAEGGRRGEIFSRLRTIRDRYGDLVRERFPDIPRRVSGFNLDDLLPEKGFNVARALVGTEGTCVTVLGATIRLVPDPKYKVMVVLGYKDVFCAGDHVPAVKAFKPIALEGLDDVLVDNMKAKGIHDASTAKLPDGAGWLLVEFGGDTEEEAERRAREFVHHLRHSEIRPSVRVVRDPEEQQEFWEVRESGLGATARVPDQPDTWEGWEDSAVAPERLGSYLRDLRALYEKYGYFGSLYGHFGMGCVHTRISFDLVTEEGVRTFRSFIEEAADLCVRHGGSFTGEHGDGQSRGELLPKLFGDELVDAFRAFKAAWDPDGKMNPGKVVEPLRLDEHLRLGATYDPPELETHFRFPDDDGSFHRAALRCVGVGKCRRVKMAQDDVMCPSWLATHEEIHTTRGRARLLFEMLNGDETPDAWDNDDVHDALDLCLACKGCKNDCPVNVDMAMYKAEFLAHYYRGRRRPRHAYALGLIHWWARLASMMPGAVNRMTRMPGLGAFVKSIGGIAPERKVPLFAEQTLRAWFEDRNEQGGTGRRVILWPDTFTNFFKPEAGKAAVEVLEAAECTVHLPSELLCCGRPLYDYGFLDLAKRLWRRILDGLRADIREGTPIIGLEPSCTAAFRDELINLFPEDPDARQLSRQTHTFAEFLTDQLDDYVVPQFEVDDSNTPLEALVHGHCHHKAVMGFDDERRLLDRLGLRYQVIPGSCCGMAGAFGFEAAHFDISMKCGEFAVLPVIRESPSDTLIIADGFSCREQIRQGTGRNTHHIAEVVRIALEDPRRYEHHSQPAH